MTSVIMSPIPDGDGEVPIEQSWKDYQIKEFLRFRPYQSGEIDDLLEDD